MNVKRCGPYVVGPNSGKSVGVYCGDSEKMIKEIPDQSLDCVFIDPPYGINIADWDQVGSMNWVISESFRVLKQDAFFAFTIQMPSMVDWLIALRESKFKFHDHVVWLKRRVGGLGNGLMHSHESLFIYRKGAPSYCEVKGAYTDVKVPGLLFNAISIEGIQRHISDLRARANGNGREFKSSGRSHAAHDNKPLKSVSAPAKTNFTTVWSFLPENANFSSIVEHPTVKPLSLMKRVVRLLTKPDDLVGDWFGGSGTTAVACKELGRRYLLFEIDCDYVELIQRRINQAKTPLFVMSEV